MAAPLQPQGPVSRPRGKRWMASRTSWAVRALRGSCSSRAAEKAAHDPRPPSTKPSCAVQRWCQTVARWPTASGEGTVSCLSLTMYFLPIGKACSHSHVKALSKVTSL